MLCNEILYVFAAWRRSTRAPPIARLAKGAITKARENGNGTFYSRT
jgi:hypothetical protein